MGWILGIKGTGEWHNSGVCLLDPDSDEILFSAEEERFNNEKKTSAYPVASLAYALDSAGITADDIEHVASPASSREYFDAVVMGFYLPLVERYPEGVGALRGALDTFKGLHRLEQFLGAEFPKRYGQELCMEVRRRPRL